MSKQATPIHAQCGHRLDRSGGRCINNAIIGTFAWEQGQTDVNLNKKPVALRCGDHKIKLDRHWPWRNVRILTA